jgi:hypothetical protein
LTGACITDHLLHIHTHSPASCILRLPLPPACVLQTILPISNKQHSSAAPLSADALNLASCVCRCRLHVFAILTFPDTQYFSAAPLSADAHPYTHSLHLRLPPACVLQTCPQAVL